MGPRHSRILSPDEHDQFWRDVEAREFGAEIGAREAGERERLEARICEALARFDDEGWDFVSAEHTEKLRAYLDSTAFHIHGGA